MQSLPDLPKQHASKEADFGVRFRKWWAKNPMTGAFELKHTNGKDSLPFKEVKAEQVAFALSAGSRSGVLARVASGTVGASDYIGLVNEPAWIVIQYPSAVHIISIGNFIFERDRSSRKSLTQERAREIASITL